jgi:hypothetical protein
MSVPHTDQVLDEYQRPVPGAQIYVTDTLTLGNAQLTIDGTVPLAQPVIADEFGFYTYWANDGIYQEDIWFSGKLRYKGLAYIGVPPQIKGDPGGTTDRFGLFSAAATFNIPVGIDIAGTTGFNTIGAGASEYVHDVAVDAAYVAANPLTSFRDVNGRGFRLMTGRPINLTHLGAGVGGDDTNALKAALLLGHVYIPQGNYNITSKITVPNGCRVTGDGRTRTIINSNVPGDSLFVTTDTVNFFYFAHMRINGNGLTGASGSGHCFNFIDPDVAGGSTTPQNGELEHIEISGFMGSDVVDNAGVTKMRSAGIIQYSGLQNTYRYIYVTDCGNAYVMRQTQNCRIENSACDNIDEAGLVSYQNVNLIVDNCDLIDCGHAFTAATASSATDAGYPVSTMGMGCVLSYQDTNFAITGTKVKIFTGQAAIIVKLGTDIVFDKCWLRGDTTVDIVPKTIYAENTSGLRITNSDFSPAVTPFVARAYETIECYTTQSAPAFGLSIEKCNFEDTSGQPISYNIKLHGNSSARTFRANIESNTFGSNASKSSPSTVTNDILLDTCKLVSSRIGGNLHTAPTNVTRTACVAATGITKVKTVIAPSEFEASGGTITANYSGINETVLWGSVAYNPAGMATGTRLTTTVTVTGVTLSATAYNVKLSMNVDMKGVNLWGYVSAADTVTAIFENNTGATQDINSGLIYARCEEYQGT